MKRRALAGSAGAVLLAATGSAAAQPPSPPPQHRLVIHVGDANPEAMAVALHNIANAIDAYAGAGQTLAVELVANGGGYTMLRADKSPVKALLAETHRRYPAVVFSACQHSRAGIAAAEGKAAKDIPELPEATDVPAGIARLIELQELGYRYVRV